MTRIYYAALDPTGKVIGVESTAGSAAELALANAPGTHVVIQELEDDDLERNAMPARDMPAHAWDVSTLPQIKQSAITMKLAAAHEKLLPFFAGLIKRGVATHAYDKPHLMADAWIGQNYKTKKLHPERPAEVMGLTLVPAAHARLAATGEGPYANLFTAEPGDDQRQAELAVERDRMLKRWRSELPKDVGPRFVSGHGFCAGSSQDCRDSCLVFAGQNASERYNTYRKVAQTMALLAEPEAFARMLVEAIERWLESPTISGGKAEPFFRCNVLSDVPWELVCPWLFDYFKDRLTFYDYTKVPGRRTPKNYDLTFSLSGTTSNRTWALEEIAERGRRIAVVFIGHKKKGESWAPVKIKGPRAIEEIPLPHVFMGLPVVDGDVSDVRPYDPAPACVGLRWKTPSGKRAGATIDLQRSSFVTPVYIVSEQQVARYARQVGAGKGLSGWRGGDGQEPNPAEEQWLICAVTPRYQPISQPMTQPA